MFPSYKYISMIPMIKYRFKGLIAPVYFLNNLSIFVFLIPNSKQITLNVIKTINADESAPLRLPSYSPLTNIII